MSRLSGDQKADAQLIGQFGVGFYSGFIVADRITVESRRAGLPPEQGVRWTSGGAGDFEVETITRAAARHQRHLHLRDDAAEYLSTWKLKSIIGKYSDHISLPILMRKEEWKEGEDGKGGEMVLTDEWETVNQASALWTPAEEGHHARAVRGVLQADQPRPRGAARLDAQPRGRRHRVHAAAVHPGAGARSTCGTATRPPA